MALTATGHALSADAPVGGLALAAGFSAVFGAAWLAATEAVSKNTWTGGPIAPGAFEDFDTSMGPLPTSADQLVFKALQTYDNGEVVRWIEDQPAGAPEPEFPAPVLKLAKAGAEAATPAPAAASSSDSGGGTALVFGIIGAVLGLVGTVLGGLALRRRTGPSVG